MQKFGIDKSKVKNWNFWAYCVIMCFIEFSDPCNLPFSQCSVLHKWIKIVYRLWGLTLVINIHLTFIHFDMSHLIY